MRNKVFVPSQKMHPLLATIYRFRDCIQKVMAQKLTPYEKAFAPSKIIPHDYACNFLTKFQGSLTFDPPCIQLAASGKVTSAPLAHNKACNNGNRFNVEVVQLTNAQQQQDAHIDTGGSKKLAVKQHKLTVDLAQQFIVRHQRHFEMYSKHSRRLQARSYTARKAEL